MTSSSELRKRCVLDINGESHYRDALAKVCGEPKEEGEDFFCIAFLVPETDNPYDANAVRVEIGDLTVGYLSRDSAVIYRQKFGAQVQEVPAHISAGWLREAHDEGEDDDRGDYCVRLALDLVS